MNDEIKSATTFQSNCLECKLQSVLLCHCVKDENNPAKKELAEGIDYYTDELQEALNEYPPKADDKITVIDLNPESLEQVFDDIMLIANPMSVTQRGESFVNHYPTMETYNQVMSDALHNFKKENIHHSIFGDIFLADLRKYREERLARAEFKGIFPLWEIPTKQLANEFIDLGFKAIIVCIDEKHLDKSFAGREFDQLFLNDLPENVDPCGEYGEFHSFVYDGPIFQKPIPFNKGEIVYRKYIPRQQQENNKDYTCGTNAHPATGFWYCDLISVSEKKLKTKKQQEIS